MPVRPIRRSDLKLAPRWPAPPPAPRPRAVPPPLPVPAPAQPMLNLKAVAVAGGAALLLVVGVLAWAASHPAGRSLSMPVGPLSDRTPPAPKDDPVAVGRDVPVPEPAPALPALPPPVAAAAARAEVIAADAPPVCETLGTSVEFDANPARAAKQAAKAQKLLMVLHVSGNFEESGFT